MADIIDPAGTLKSKIAISLERLLRDLFFYQDFLNTEQALVFTFSENEDSLVSTCSATLVCIFWSGFFVGITKRCIRARERERSILKNNPYRELIAHEPGES